MSDPTQQPVTYDVVDEEQHTQNANDIRPFEKRFVMYHRAILYAFVALLLVTVTVLITYAVTKAGETASTAQTSEQHMSMPSFMTELSTIVEVEDGLYESCGLEDFWYTDAEGTCCSGTNFVYWNEQFLCCSGDVEAEIASAGLTCSTAETVMSSGDECDCPSESVAGPCIEDFDGMCCEFQELVYQDTPDDGEQWLCCGMDAACVMEYSVLAPVPVSTNVDSSIVYFTPDVTEALAAAKTITKSGVSVESWEEFVADAFTVSDDDDWKFEQYTKAFDKTYESDEEKLYRRVVFMYNDQVAKALDESTDLATFGWTQFSDWTTEEFQAIQGTVPTQDEIKIGMTFTKLTTDLKEPIMGRRRAAAIMDKINSRRRQVSPTPEPTVDTQTNSPVLSPTPEPISGGPDGSGSGMGPATTSAPATDGTTSAPATGAGSGMGPTDGPDDECEDDCGPEGHWSGWQCGSDKQENGCEWYTENPDACGDYDVSGFTASFMCCACGGGNIEPSTTENPSTTSGMDHVTETTSSMGFCQDTANGAEDNYGDGCEWYEGYPAWCGYFDDDDFSANLMCCACGGGLTEPTAEPTEEPTVEPTNDPTRDPDAKPTQEPTEEPTTLQPTYAPVEGLNINYVEMGMTTDVKNQGSCGSCWAFAAAQVIESAMLVANNMQGTANAGIPLSEQEYVSCSSAGTCNGGWPFSAFQWVQSSTNGLCFEETFPYTGQDDACAVDVNDAGVSDSVPVDIWTATDWCWDECTDQYLQEPDMAELLIEYGTINVNIHASTAWSSYTGGIMDYDSCGGSYASSSSGLDHAVQLVGINSENDPAYWIVRNSWGTGWGEDGFIYLEYGTNTCGIANCPGLVTVE